MGRPKKKPGEARDKVVPIKFKESEIDLIKEVAAEGIAVSTHIRSVVLEDAKKKKKKKP